MSLFYTHKSNLSLGLRKKHTWSENQKAVIASGKPLTVEKKLLLRQK